MFLVGLVTVTGQKATLVNYLTLGNFELVQESHSIKPVVESDEEKGKSREEIRQCISQEVELSGYNKTSCKAKHVMIQALSGIYVQGHQGENLSSLLLIPATGTQLFELWPLATHQ